LTPVSLWTWQAPVITAAVTVGSDATATVTVTNSISKDRGGFSFTKVLLNPEGAAVQATFPLSWDCGVDTTKAALTGMVDLAAGATQTVSDIPTGNSCSVTEAALTPVSLWTWQAPVITAAVTVGSDPETTGLVTVTNKITKDDVLPPQPESIVITLPNTGTTIPLTWLLAAIGIVAAGVILLGASRFSARGRKN